MNNIEFNVEDPRVIDYFPIKPASKCVPDWYKQMPMWKQGNDYQGNYFNLPSIKHCIPAQDMITSGYIIHNTYEVQINQIENSEPKEWEVKGHNPSHIQFHNFAQMPVDFNNKKKHFIKIDQPWTIKTPKGYSCLFVQPFYHFEKRFQLFPAVVDTDVYDMPVLLPGVLLQEEPITLEPNTPLMQVIPFKRESWKMQMTSKNKVKSLLDYFWSSGYRKIFHQKKKFD